MDEIVISVVIPANNIENYIANCLDSILAQTWRSLEVIVVDDGSTDQTGKIIDDYAAQDARIRSIHQANGGVSQARLTGIKAAKGDYIGFVDGDDVVEADMYDRLLKNALKYHADISHCGFQIIVNEGEKIHYFYNTGRIIRQTKLDGVKDLIEGRFIEPSLCNKLFSQKLIRKLLYQDLMDWSLRTNEDVLMNYLLFKEADDSVYEDFCSYHYLSRPTSASRSDFKAYKVLEPVKVWKWILDDSSADIEPYAWRRYLTACGNAYSKLSSDKEYKEDSQLLKEELRKNRSKWQYMTRNERIKTRFMLISSGLYRVLYSAYERTIQNRKYE